MSFGRMDFVQQGVPLGNIKPAASRREAYEDTAKIKKGGMEAAPFIIQGGIFNENPTQHYGVKRTQEFDK